MVYRGYFRYDGIEIVNSARMKAYGDSMRLGFFDSNDTCGSLPDALEVQGFDFGPYLSPGTGGTAPWYNPLDPHTAEFAGVHVLDVANIASSTYGATIEESVSDGGWISRGRYGTRSMVFRVLLAGSSMRGVYRGLSWLTTVLRNGDPCRNSVRTRHTYTDFLPRGKPWWTSYRSDSTVARPDNLYQANRYLGLSTTDDPEVAPGEIGSGNTYAKLHSGGLDGFDADALDLLVKLSGPDPIAAFDTFCNGNVLEYFIQCPTADTSDYDYRYMVRVDLTSGPTVLAERSIGGEACTGGAWLEVEFTLTAANPFAWWKKRDLTLDASNISYGFIPTEWEFYKETTDLQADDDVYQAPLVAGRQQTYADLYSTVFYKFTVPPAVYSEPVPATVAAVRAVADPTCPSLPEFPRIPQEDFLCRPLNELGPFNTRRYVGYVAELEPDTPAAVRLSISSLIAEYRDLLIRVLPEGAVENPDQGVELHVLYMPPGATLVIDGVRRSMDILLSDELHTTSLRWERASHLVVSQGAGVYKYPELLCGRNFMVEVNIPVEYDPDILTVAIEAVGRDM